MNTTCLPRTLLSSDAPQSRAAVGEFTRLNSARLLRAGETSSDAYGDAAPAENGQSRTKVFASVAPWLWLLPAWLLPVTLGWTVDGSTAAAWLWVLLCGTCSLGVFFRLLATPLWTQRHSNAADKRDIALVAGALLLMTGWSWTLPAICLLLFLPAALLETSANRMCRIPRQAGMRAADVDAARCRLQGMYIDLLRLFGVLLMVGGAVWLTGQTELTNGDLATLIGLMAVYIWGITARLARSLQTHRN